MIPTNRLLRLLAFLAVFGAVASIWSQLALAWWVVAGALLGVGGFDFLFGWASARLRVERRMPGRFAVGVPQEVAVTLHNPGRMPLTVEFFDGLPPGVESAQLPWRGQVPGRGYTTVAYLATSLERGLTVFTPCTVRVHSPLGLWQKQRRGTETHEVRTYPNYEPILRYTLLAMSNRTSQMGIVTKNRVGQSREFHQLRDYQDGDILSQIDWKATARRGQIISREYREQRDQTLIFLLDSGRRMRALDGGLPQFDHCLNATLLLSYIALRQGDQVGVLGFGGNDRWLPPVKGPHSMNVVLNHLYDYQSTTEPSDFSEAAERLMARQKRRALVVLLTNLRSEDATHLLQPLQLLRRRHLVVVASLREQSVMEQLNAPVSVFDDALHWAAAGSYLSDRREFLAKLSDQGLLVLDETAQSLPSALSSAYLDIKRRGAL